MFSYKRVWFIVIGACVVCAAVGFLAGASFSRPPATAEEEIHSLMINTTALGYLTARSDVPSATLVLKSNSDGLIVDLDKLLKESSDSHVRESFKTWACRYAQVRSQIQHNSAQVSENELSPDITRILSEQECPGKLKPDKN